MRYFKCRIITKYVTNLFSPITLHLTHQKLRFFIQIILSEVLPQANERAAPKVNSANKVLKKIATAMKLQLFGSKIDPFDERHWSDKIHLSDFGLSVFMQNLESFCESCYAGYRISIADFPALDQRSTNADRNETTKRTTSK